MRVGVDGVKRRGWSTLVLLATAMLVLGCGRATEPPNVLLVTLDTTRADRLGCYGYAAAETPTMDALAESGVRFADAHVQVPLTLASHASLLTGTYPRVNGVHVNGATRLGDGIPTLAERLTERGYRTAAFVSAYVLDSTFGLDRGFETYDDEQQSGDQFLSFEYQRTADDVADAALGWLAQTEARPFFAWVHFFDPHAPYTPPEGYRDRFEHPYDGEIAYVDAQLRRLVDWLDERKIRDRTLVVVAGDHGESLGEHDEPEHGYFVYDTTVRAPLLLSWPSRLPAGKVVETAVGLVDVYSTILDLVGAPGNHEGDGQSLAPLMEAADPPPPRSVYGESYYAQIGYGWAPLRYLITDDWKYVEAPRPELYDRHQDPGESSNLIDDRPDEAAALRDELLRLEQTMVPRESEPAELDSEALAKLRALGYVGGTSSPVIDPGADLSSLRDPKDMLEVYRGHHQAANLMRQRRFREAVALLERLVARSPESIDIYKDLGWAYLSTGRSAQAEEACRKSLTNNPNDPDRLWGLAEALRRQNKNEEAIATYQRALELRPVLGEAHMGLALIYANTGDLQRAYEHGRQHVELDPRSLRALINQANIAYALQRYDEAVQLTDRALELRPQNAEAHYVRWEALARAGQRDAAIAALREARQALPDDWLITCALAWMLAVTPQQEAAALDDALQFAQRAVELNPEHWRSHDALAAAHAARGSFAEAVAEARQALALARGPQAAPLRTELQARLELYQARRPYHE